MSRNEKTGSSSSIFLGQVRTMRADELERIVGGGSGPASGFGRYKSTSSVDNAMKNPT